MYLISAYFDDATNRILQKIINHISNSTGNTYMIENNVPPHLTISAIEARTVEVIIPAFEELNGKLKSGKIHFVSVGQLLPYVVYVTPVLNEYLQNLQFTINMAVKDIDETKVSKYYRPYRWLPHVTLAKKLEKNQMMKAFKILQDQFVPFEATVTEIGLASVNPHEDVLRFHF